MNDPVAQKKKSKAWIWWLLGGLVALLLTGFLVAQSAFKKYIRKSKTAEARMFLRKMESGARYYWDSGELGSMEAAPPKFPESVGPTPPLGTCCEDPSGTCQPDENLWNHPSWVALDMFMMDPHYYSYEFRSTSTDGEGYATFEVLAYGDLDCDGTYSTFRMAGRAHVESGVEPSSAMERIQELE